MSSTQKDENENLLNLRELPYPTNSASINIPPTDILIRLILTRQWISVETDEFTLTLPIGRDKKNHKFFNKKKRTGSFTI